MAQRLRICVRMISDQDIVRTSSVPFALIVVAIHLLFIDMLQPVPH